ncbi:type II secretion system F family protein [Agromyces sp. S2-1-8]|uniref:type II secretion system F family protein n=1 Tax=Agromyces sp. S2-1-8 TaxID=2897180 RepID=UPI001E44E769|nr:type II secretion system F family protein [Agromyces sp. S2-1-8]MCD5344947.1 type II secretion system F family protein [Agromyces sp. S2-1-8]
MDAGSIIAYISAIVVAAALGVLVFLLFPARKVETEPANVDEAPAVDVSRERTSFAESLAAAAPKGYVGWLERQIVFAGRPAGWSARGLLTWKLILGIGAVVFGFLFVYSGGPQPFKVLLAIAAIILLFFAPDILANSRAHDRQQAIVYALPDTLDQMTIAVEAGLGFDSAMAKAARGGDGPLAEELIRVLQDMSIGRTRREAFEELGRRTNSDDLRRFIRAIVQADAYGLAIGEVLRVQAGEMRTKRRQRAEEQAQKVTVKIIFPLIFCLLPAMFIVILTPAVLGIMNQFAR